MADSCKIIGTWSVESLNGVPDRSCHLDLVSDDIQQRYVMGSVEIGPN